MSYEAHEVELTPEQQVVHDRFTRYVRTSGSHLVTYDVGNQHFTLAYYPEAEEEAQWMRKMLAIALVAMMKELAEDA